MMKKMTGILFALAGLAVAASVSAAPTKRTVPACTIKNVTTTTTVKAGKTFDGLVEYGKWTCLVGTTTNMNGSQAENQLPHFNLEEGATLKNVILGNPNFGTGRDLKAGGADGVHCLGNCTISNVYWGDVGEDGATMKGKGTMTITGGAAFKAKDKIFMNNGAGSKVVISDFYAEEAGKLYRTCGNCSTQSARYADISNVTLYNVSHPIIVSSSFDAAKLPALKSAYDIATIKDVQSNVSPVCIGSIGTSKGNEPVDDTNKDNVARSCIYK